MFLSSKTRDVHLTMSRCYPGLEFSSTYLITSVSLSIFAVLERLSAEGASVYVAAGKGNVEVFEIDNGAVRK